MYRPIQVLLAAPTLLAAAIAATPAYAEPLPDDSVGVVAQFEGRLIDLSLSWEGAQACAVLSGGARCYRTEAEMDRALATDEQAGSEIAPFGTCGSSLRLYDGTSYGTPVLSLTTTGSLILLSSHGFDNVTSSYKVGACAANLYNGIQTSLYPGNTGAGAQASSMLAGWNNVISSVLIP